LPQTKIPKTNTGSSVLLLFGIHLFIWFCWVLDVCMGIISLVYTQVYKSGYVLTLLRALFKKIKMGELLVSHPCAIAHI